MEDKIRVLVPEKDVDAKIAELGKKISEDYADVRCIWYACSKAACSLCVSLQRELRFPYPWIL